MKKRLAIILLALTLVLIPTFVTTPVKAADLTFAVSDFQGLKDAVAKANSSTDVTIYLSGEIEVESNITVKGTVTVIGDSSAVLLMNTASNKTGFELKKNCNLTVKDLTVKRTVADESERFVFYTYDNNVSLNFENVVFDVKTLEVASINYDRITYCSTAGALTVLANGCKFLTDGYFYRGTLVFFNCDTLPQTGGSAEVKDFTGLKIDYQTGKLTFSSDISVSTQDNFATLVKNGDAIKSETTYYVQKGGFTFSFTSKKLKMETPNQASVSIDFFNETASFSSEYLVSRTAGFSQLLQSGDTVYPSEKLYVKRPGSGIFADSEVFVLTLPARERAVETVCAFVCEFGFAIEHMKGLEYKIGDTYQDSPVFIGLQSKTEYTVTLRMKATSSSFCSESFTLKVTTK